MTCQQKGVMSHKWCDNRENTSAYKRIKSEVTLFASEKDLTAGAKQIKNYNLIRKLKTNSPNTATLQMSSIQKVKI